MSAADGFSDLPYSDYPAVDSDDRYLYRDIQLDDIEHINTYERLFAAVKAAGTESARSSAWSALQDFTATAEYTDHVEPVLTTAMKFQRLEDCLLACQRFAKRQAQQWTVSETEPDSSAQAVGDIWFRPTGTVSSGVAGYTMYRKTASGYTAMSIRDQEAADQIAAVNSSLGATNTTVSSIHSKVTALTASITEMKKVSSLPSDASGHATTLYLVTG